jgi:hypothetical protein
MDRECILKRLFCFFLKNERFSIKEKKKQDLAPFSSFAFFFFFALCTWQKIKTNRQISRDKRRYLRAERCCESKQNRTNSPPIFGGEEEEEEEEREERGKEGEGRRRRKRGKRGGKKKGGGGRGRRNYARSMEENLAFSYRRCHQIKK